MRHQLKLIHTLFGADFFVSHPDSRLRDAAGFVFLKQMSKDEFCDKNRQWEYLRPYLKDRLKEEWTVFSIYKKKNEKKITKREKKHSGTKKHKQEE